MSFEIGPTHFTGPPPAGRPASARPAPNVSFEATLQAATTAAATPSARFDTTQLGIPASPPSEVLDQVAAAADRVRELAAARRELHFERDKESGRVVVQVRDIASGEVIRTIPPSEALNVMSGASL
jgi:uncharacterized FlaG/YvyC family protein